jgi:hypothetical protein
MLVVNTSLQQEQMHPDAWASLVGGLRSRKRLCKKKMTGFVAHICNPNYVGDIGRTMMGQGRLPVKA